MSDDQFHKNRRIAFTAVGYEWSLIAEALESYAIENGNYVDTSTLMDYVDEINKKLGFE